MPIQATTGAGAPSVRNRTRVGAAGGQRATPGNPGATADWMQSGAAAIEGHKNHQEYVAQRREERQAEIGVPFRLFLAKGEEVDAIILDNDFGPGLFEHDLTHHDRFKRLNPRNGRPFDQFVLSPQQWESDPLSTEVGLTPYYATFLTIAVLKPFTDNRGVHHSYQRRLVALKGEAMEMMSMIRAQQIRAGFHDAPLRGVHVVFKRGMADQSLRTGLPIFNERHSEAEIMETFGHPAIMAEQGQRSGQIVKHANEDCFPIDYLRSFPKPSADNIRRRFGLGMSSVAGAAGQGRSHFNDSQSHDGAADGGTQGFADGGQRHFDDGDTSTDGFADGGNVGSGFADDIDDEIPF